MKRLKSPEHGAENFNAGGGLTLRHPTVVKILAVQFQISQERLGISTTRKNRLGRMGYFYLERKQIHPGEFRYKNSSGTKAKTPR